MHGIFDIVSFVKATSYLGVFSFIFLESGVAFGFFLPGDSLLFTAGLLASQGILSIWILIPVSIAGAIIGNSVGFYTGAKIGPRLFTREKSVFFSPKRVQEAHEFFDAQGPKSLILARFIPGIRTFLPIVAGVAKMNYRTFIIFNAVGGALWGILVPILGFTLGRVIPNVDTYLLPIVGVIVIISVIPVVHQYLSARKRTKQQ